MQERSNKWTKHSVLLFSFMARTHPSVVHTCCACHPCCRGHATYQERSPIHWGYQEPCHPRNHTKQMLQRFASCSVHSPHRPVPTYQLHRNRTPFKLMSRQSFLQICPSWSRYLQHKLPRSTTIHQVAPKGACDCESHPLPDQSHKL